MLIQKFNLHIKGTNFKAEDAYTRRVEFVLGY